MSKASRRNRQLQAAAGNQRQFLVQQQQVRVGPIPTPEELQKYDQALPGLAERIVSMAEKNAEDRWKANRTLRTITVLGPIFAFILAMTALLGGFYLVYKGRDVAGMAAIITAIAAPLSVFIYRRVHPPQQQ